MIRACTAADNPAICAVVNDAAAPIAASFPPTAGASPTCRGPSLEAEIAAGVAFLACEEAGALVGVMVTQAIDDVTLIRHAYVVSARRRRGIGGELLGACLARTSRPVLIGTWAAASWAIDFYRKHGFAVIDGAEKDRLLATYWSIPARQMETSVVLADRRWRAPGAGRLSSPPASPAHGSRGRG